MEPSGNRWRVRGEDLLVVLAAGLFAAGLCFISPSVRDGLDYVTIWKGYIHFLTDAVREGRLPLWNPYMHLGRPYLADMPNETFYPPMYLVLLGENAGVFLLVWLHSLIAVSGVRKLAAALGVGRWQGCFMAISFVACGPMTMHWVTGQLHYCWAISYMPWLFYCAVRTDEPWRGSRLALYAVLLALQFLCIPQVFWFSAIGQALFIFTRALKLPVREAARDAWHGLWQFGVACVWCAALAAVVLMPYLELIKESNRSDNSAAFVNSYNLAWAQLGSLYSPLSYGFGWENNFFVGAIAVVLGTLGLTRVRDRNVRGLLGVLAGALLIALGDKTFFFGLFYKWLPGFADFRFHCRAVLLIVLVLICAGGIWLSRPHLRLRSWWTRIFGVPLRYAVITLVLLQSLQLLWGTWEFKRIVTIGANRTLLTPPNRSFEQMLAAKLQTADLMKPGQTPPRVCVPPSLVPVNYGMIYHYSSLDAHWSPFLKRPWDYLHAMLGITSAEDKASVSSDVYGHGPFPYPDLGLSFGTDPNTWEILVATNPAPRAFLVYAAEVSDYGAILKRLAGGFDIHQCALLEKPLAAPLPGAGALPGTPAVIRRFEPNSLRVDVDAATNALLVLAEGWYPGWRAEIDGRVSECVPANIVMRAVPVPAGRHEVRVYFHQNHLLAGLLVSLASAGLVLAVLIRSRRRAPAAAGSREGSELRSAAGGEGSAGLPESAQPAATVREPIRLFWRALCTLAAGGLLVWLVAATGMHEARQYHAFSVNVDSASEYWQALTLFREHQTARAIAVYTDVLRLTPGQPAALNDLAWIRATSAHAEFRDGPEAVRLAERACKLSGYREPLFAATLAAAYAEAGRFDEAVAAAQMSRQLAQASGQNQLAGKDLGLIQLFTDRRPYHGTN